MMWVATMVRARVSHTLNKGEKHRVYLHLDGGCGGRRRLRGFDGGARARKYDPVLARKAAVSAHFRLFAMISSTVCVDLTKTPGQLTFVPSATLGNPPVRIERELAVVPAGGPRKRAGVSLPDARLSAAVGAHSNTVGPMHACRRLA